ncbi:2,3-diketo-L-gulonate TRAP transporter small permease protein YiaM [Roseivivax sp. THAF40]|uniref:TRAP transporter small permease n=1 Tax=unclassified Roseivivax TaxID=2639302 RepID=UPI0012679A03|nr:MULTISPECIES: TRAP transporter small permease subunit [unclassified Roseivivax]QFS81237.1 2,3-diketo-L-gulonate TRAP transporter small permease protein YiaM [Roseivivax sp. THAF197b]QFT44966.1 2,3-diketo-L-gulonate TRAP transporter small permease protein YiaM [Roseivivax sp. THAF40]
MTVAIRLYERLLATLAGLCMAALFGIVCVNSLRRYTTGESLRWGEELPIYLTIYGVMFGVALACLQDRHIRFSVLADLLSETARAQLRLLTDAATVAIGGALTWSGWVFATRRPQIEASGLISTAKAMAETTGIAWLEWLGRVGTWQSAIAVGGAALTLAAALQLAAKLRRT